MESVAVYVLVIVHVTAHGKFYKYPGYINMAGNKDNIVELSNHSELLEAIRKIPIISRYDKSFEYPSESERYAFFLYERPDESSALKALKTILDITGFEDLYENIAHIAYSIQDINGTKKLPLFGIGFSVNKRKVTQLKVYYLLTVIEFEREDAMSKHDNDASMQVMQHLLKELQLDDKAQEVSSLINYMSDNGNDMHIVGLNVEKDKPLSLKLYFSVNK